MGSTAVKHYLENRGDRNNNSGGVITYVKESLKPKVLEKEQATFKKKLLEVTVTQIELHNRKKFIIIGIYRPPNSNAAWFQEFNEVILTTLAISPLIIMGYINCDLLKPEKQSTKSLLASLTLASTIVKKS